MKEGSLMKASISALLGWILLACNIQICYADETMAGKIFKENRAAVVRVEVSLAPDSPVQGTGFIISNNGYVLTAKHVLDAFKNNDTTPVSVRIGYLANKPVAAEFIPFYTGVDVALLKLADPETVMAKDYQTVNRGDSSKVNTGDALFIVGFNRSDNISVQQATLGSKGGGTLEGSTLWQVTAGGGINGMSGAPVFDQDGLVVGVIQGGLPGTGLTYVVPEQLLETLAAQARWKMTTENQTGNGAHAISRGSGSPPATPNGGPQKQDATGQSSQSVTATGGGVAVGNIYNGTINNSPGK
jgi:hypothetical protein